MTSFLSNAYPSSIVCQSLLFMGSPPVTSKCSKWIPNGSHELVYHIDLLQIVSGYPGFLKERWVLLFLSFFHFHSTQIDLSCPPPSCPITRQGVRSSLICYGEVFHSSNSSDTKDSSTVIASCVATFLRSPFVYQSMFFPFSVKGQ